jgi:hypothetical protein
MRSRRLRLISTLDKVFSEFIRRRDEKQGCITCGKIIPWKEADNGHYIRRGVFLFRWHEKNCHLQCKRCNCWMEGEKDIYRAKLIERYGKEFVELMEAERHKTCKIGVGDLEIMIMDYKNKLKSPGAQQ